MKELLEGRRLGFAPRPVLAGAVLGLGVAVTLLDLMAWAGWGSRVTNAFLIASEWVAGAAALLGLLGLVAAFAELTDAPDEDRTLARLDVVAAAAVAALYAVTAALRALEVGAAASSPAALLLALAGLIVAFADVAMSSVLYASREWEEVEEIHERHGRRRAASR